MKTYISGIEKLKEDILIFAYNRIEPLINQYRFESTWGMRSKVVENFCVGGGIEIGASAYPVPVLKKDINVKYVDYRDRNEVHDSFWNKNIDYVHVDIIDDAERLDKIRNSSLDFIVVCHLLEHTKNPIAALETWMKKLKKYGRLVVAIPDMSTIFDRERQLTSFEHLRLDYEEPSDVRDYEHYEEYIKLTTKCKNDVREEISRYLKEDLRIHYHCWNFCSFFDFLINSNYYLNNKFSILSYNYNLLNKGKSGKEIIAVLEKR